MEQYPRGSSEILERHSAGSQGIVNAVKYD